MSNLSLSTFGTSWCGHTCPRDRKQASRCLEEARFFPQFDSLVASAIKQGRRSRNRSTMTSGSVKLAEIPHRGAAAGWEQRSGVLQHVAKKFDEHLVLAEDG